VIAIIVESRGFNITPHQLTTPVCAAWYHAARSGGNGGWMRVSGEMLARGLVSAIIGDDA
jgi:hypothetical protein